MIEVPAESAAITRGWFDRPSVALAPDLLGARLVHDAPEGTVGGRIVEVGPPEELLTRRSAFGTLWSTQESVITSRGS